MPHEAFKIDKITEDNKHLFLVDGILFIPHKIKEIPFLIFDGDKNTMIEAVIAPGVKKI